MLGSGVKAESRREDRRQVLNEDFNLKLFERKNRAGLYDIMYKTEDNERVNGGDALVIKK